MNWQEQVVLVTGGTGSFGKKFVQVMLRDYQPQKLIIFSRDELKQHDMRTAGFDHPSLRYFIGDVRDPQRLQRAFSGVTIVVHAAALKQVPACEYNPFEAVQTNIMGGRNVIDAAIDQGVRRVLALSTDKAVSPINLYGATKLCAEKMFVQANAYAGAQDTRFSCARYGNVVGSRGSVIPVFMEQRKRGKITITDSRMTRFWLTLEHGVRFVVGCIGQMHGGEIFVPKIPSMRLTDMAETIAPGGKVARGAGLRGRSPQHGRTRGHVRHPAGALLVEPAALERRPAAARGISLWQRFQPALAYGRRFAGADGERNSGGGEGPGVAGEARAGVKCHDCDSGKPRPAGHPRWAARKNELVALWAPVHR